MVYSLALHLLGDRDEALDLSQEVFLRVFRTLSSFRGQSALRTWIYRIVINQARNRQRWWRRRHRSSQVSLDEHLQQFGDVESKTEVLPDRLLASKETVSADLAGARSAAVRSADGADPARDRRAALRRDRVLARRRGRHGEVAAHARAAGAARRAAGAADMIPYVGCEYAREHLDAFVDGELSVAEQVAVESHLRWCRTCAARVEDLQLIGASIRLGSLAPRATTARKRRRSATCRPAC